VNTRKPKQATKRKYRPSRERTTAGQAQTLWTLMVTIAFVLAALSQLRSSSKVALFEEGARTPAEVIQESSSGKTSYPQIAPVKSKAPSKNKGGEGISDLDLKSKLSEQWRLSWIDFQIND
tara:strand:+ start:72 stop:434 length:363 start_codon:yes stop_codon:yes gene_type:complete